MGFIDFTGMIVKVHYTPTAHSNSQLQLSTMRLEFYNRLCTTRIQFCNNEY